MWSRHDTNIVPLNINNSHVHDDYRPYMCINQMDFVGALFIYMYYINISIYSRNYTEKQIWIRFTGRFGWNRNCLCIFFSVFNSFGFMQINYRCVPFRQYYPIYINLYINSVPSLFTNMHNMQYEPSSRCVVCCVSNVERIN